MIDQLCHDPYYVSRADVVVLDANLHFALHPDLGPYVSRSFSDHITIAAVASIVRARLGCDITICDKRGYRIIIE
jgi:hypothetical protein